MVVQSVCLQTIASNKFLSSLSLGVVTMITSALSITSIQNKLGLCVVPC